MMARRPRDPDDMPLVEPVKPRKGRVHKPVAERLRLARPRRRSRFRVLAIMKRTIRP